MICPRCQTRLSDDAAICDNCNYIINTAFLGNDITKEEGSAETVPGKADVTKVLDVKPELPRPAVDRPGTPSAEGSGPRRPDRIDRIAAPHVSVTNAADDLLSQFRSFPFGERLATGGALAFLISLGLPWHYSDTDDAIGLFAGAGPLGLLAIVTLAAAYVRRGEVMRKWGEDILVLSLASSTAALCGTAWFFSRAFERVWVNMAGKAPAQEWKVLPHVGLVLALVGSIVMLIGAGTTYRDRLRARA